VTADTSPTRLGVDEAVEFWDTRHRVRGDLQSGGDLTYDHATNEIFYALRLGRLIDQMGDLSNRVTPLRVLDAGCGKGWFARAVARFGHQVDGIDSSAHAIEECRRLAVGNENYEQCLLQDWSPSYLYDVVYSIDVLFHIMDDEVWSQAVRALARAVRFGGSLLLVDHDRDEDIVWGEYQVTRATSRYVALLGGCGLEYRGFTPYRCRDNAAGFHRFIRVG